MQLDGLHSDTCQLPPSLANSLTHSLRSRVRAKPRQTRSYWFWITVTLSEKELLATAGMDALVGLSCVCIEQGRLW